MPAPAYPADLDGERAPIMLGYLPPYYVQSVYVRELLEAEGAELDTLWGYARSMSDLTLPDDCPTWAVPMWEAVLGLKGRTGWTYSERRAAILARFRGEVVQEDGFIAYLDAESNHGDPADIDVAIVGNAMTITLTGFSTSETHLLTKAAELSRPAHLTLTVA